MKTFTIDLHHVVLYVVLAAVSFGAFSVIRTWREDLVTAKQKTIEAEKTIEATDRAAADRAKQYEAQIALLQSQLVTPKTPPAVILTRLQGLEPSMNVLPDQLIAPKPDAPKANLVLEPSQQVTLVNHLIECHECEDARTKLTADLGDETLRRIATERELDAWKTAAKGGSLWNRVKRRAWYFLEDAIAIEAMRCAGGHC